MHQILKYRQTPVPMVQAVATGRNMVAKNLREGRKKRTTPTLDINYIVIDASDHASRL